MEGVRWAGAFCSAGDAESLCCWCRSVFTPTLGCGHGGEFRCPIAQRRAAVPPGPEPLEEVQASGTRPLMTQDTLEELDLLALECLESPPKELEKLAVERSVWAFLMKPIPPPP